MICNTSEQTVLLPKYKHNNTPTKSIFWFFHYVNMSDARFTWIAWIANIIFLKKENIELYMFFENDKQLHINDLLAGKLINTVIDWSIARYLKNNLTYIKKMSNKEIKFLSQKIIFLT